MDINERMYFYMGGLATLVGVLLGEILSVAIAHLLK